MASTAPTFARTASRASRLLWISESTTIRTPSNLAACRSPWPPLARAGVARVAGRDTAARGGDDQSVALKAVDRDGTDVQRPAAERIDRPFRYDQFGVDVAALPGDQGAARFEQRECELDELGEAGHGPDGHPGPATAMATVSGQRLGADGCGLDRVRETRGTRDGRQ